jgi:hypothetical protein
MHTEGIVAAILPLHILAGGLALVFGYAALAAKKGPRCTARAGCCSSARWSPWRSQARSWRP